MGTANVVRLILIVDVAAMALLALFYLRQRQLAWYAFCGWCLLAVAVPVLGPFLVIATRPGRFDPDFSFWHDFAGLGEFLRRLLPVAPPRSTRLAKARKRRTTRARD